MNLWYATQLPYWQLLIMQGCYSTTIEGALFHLYYCWNVIPTWDPMCLIQCRHNMKRKQLSIVGIA